MGLGLSLGLSRHPRGGASGPPAWTPASLGAALVAAMDVSTGRTRGGLLYQTSGATYPAYADGDLLYTANDPWTKSVWASYANTMPTLQFTRGKWGSVSTAGGWQLTGLSLPTPFTVVMACQAANYASAYNVPFSGNSNNMAVGWDNSGRLFNYTSTGFQTAGSLVDGNPHVISAVVGNGTTGRLRLDGAQVAAGTNAPITLSQIQLMASGAGQYYSGNLWRCLIASGDIGDAAIAQAEAWVNAASSVATFQPYLWFGFNQNDTTFANDVTNSLSIWESPDLLNFTLLSRNWAGSGSVRDSRALKVGSAWYMGYTSGAFGNATSFGLAKAANWPIVWNTYATVDCSDVLSTAGANTPRCWFSDLFFDGTTLYALFCGSNTGGADTGFKLYYKTSVAPFTSWSAAVQFTGSVFGTNCIDHHINLISGVYHLIWKDENLDEVCSATSSSFGSGYNTGGPITGLTSPLEGAGCLNVSGSNWYMFNNAYSTSGPIRYSSADNLATFGAGVNVNLARGGGANGTPISAF